MNNWNICGQSVQAGEKKQLMLHPAVSGYEIPATLICGIEAGQTILITAGIHSGEYPGIPAVIKLAKGIDPMQVAGRILIMHCVNTSGFKAKSPAALPEDGFNLNHDYPGDENGTTGQKIAAFFIREVFTEVDFIVDLHSGGDMEPLTPCLFFPAAAGEKVREVSLNAAKATNIPYLIASKAATGEYSYAAAMGIPGLLLERGHSNFCKKEWIEAYYEDIRLLLDHLEIYALQECPSVCDKTIYEKTIYFTADQGGLWYPEIEVDQQIAKGQLLGHLEDFFGNRVKEYYTEETGRVFYYTSGLSVNTGDPLVAYGLEKVRGE